MATTNFLVWDPTLANAETDSLYSADAIRSGGAVADDLLPSALANKAYYQWSTFVAAFCQMLVNKNVSTSDSNFSNLVSVLSTVRIATDFPNSVVVVPYATAIAFNAGGSSGFDVSLTGNVSSSTISGQTLGQILTFVISQDATGNRSFVWPTNVPGATICPLASSTTVQAFFVRASGVIVPFGAPMWATSAGVMVYAPAAVTAGISTSGNIVPGAGVVSMETLNVSGGSINRYLPNAVGMGGMKFTETVLGPASTNFATILPLIGGQTISGQPSFNINPYESFDFMSDNANWFLV